MWMMVLIVSMQIGGAWTQVAEVRIKNFANQPDCMARMATVTYSLPSANGPHNVTAVCQPQTGP